MIGNNSCGAHSVMAGRTEDNVEELEVVAFDGVRLRVELAHRLGRTTVRRSIVVVGIAMAIALYFGIG